MIKFHNKEYFKLAMAILITQNGDDILEHTYTYTNGGNQKTFHATPDHYLPSQTVLLVSWGGSAARQPSSDTRGQSHAAGISGKRKMTQEHDRTEQEAWIPSGHILARGRPNRNPF